jgi:glycolate dehydrogenase iron-sulfur subunit
MHDATVSTAPLSPLQNVLHHAETSCIQCGFCLPKCPTYRLTGDEAASPRGRIDLMRAVADDDLTAGEIFTQLDFCLGCRACESACPAGVEFGKLLEAGRAEARGGRTGSRLGALVQRLCLQALLPVPALVQQCTSFLHVYQVSGLQQFLRTSGVLRHLAPMLATMEMLLPRVPARAERRPVPIETPPVGIEQGRVAMLTGCIMPAFLPEVNRATARVLAANGYRVYAPPAQRCCGALQAHAGEIETARQLAQHNIAIFEATGADWVVVNSAGCGALMKEYGHLLRDDPAFAIRAEAFSKCVRDVSEMLTAAPLRQPLHPVPLRVAYDDPCHLLHGQKVHEQPRHVLRQIPELILLEVTESDWCCGSAGIYNLLHPETAQALLDRKMRHLAAVEPQLIVTGNPGCILQLRQGVTQYGLAAEVLHPVEVLARAYGTPAEEGKETPA